VGAAISFLELACTKLLKSHAAAVQFALSALFLILAVLLAWRV